MEIKCDCPLCGKSLWNHDSYERTVHHKSKSYKIKIIRKLCSDCNRTFSLIPSFVKPWARFANHIWEFLARFVLEGILKYRLPELLSSERTSIISLRTIYRWMARLKERTSAWRNEQLTQFVRDYEAGDSLLELYRHGVHTNEEWHFLFFHFFGGDMPKRGTIFSKVNLHLPTNRLW